jgi:hypothetical protein
VSTIARAVGVSYRRLDYWARCGYLRADGEGSGSGVRRRFSDDELRVAQLMARLVDAGLTVPTAANVARCAIADERGGSAYAHLAEGVYLSVVLDLGDVAANERTRDRK